MSGSEQTPPIAKPAVRRRLWESLGLGPHDGTVYRERGEKGDRIVLALRPSLVERFKNVSEFEGFDVDVRPASAAKPYGVSASA